MANRPSKIDRLDPDVRELIGRLRARGRHIDEIMAKLRELDVDVSRSSLGRHIQEIDAISEEIRRSRGVAEALVERFGDAPESRTARLNIELMHSQLMRLLVPGEDGKVTMDAQGAYFLSTALARLGQASKLDVDEKTKAEERAKKRAREEAVAAVESVARTEKGLSRETVEAIKAKILGVDPPAKP